MACRERPPWRSGNRHGRPNSASRNATEGVPYRLSERNSTLTAIRATASALLVCFFLLQAAFAEDRVARPDVPEWLDQVQTYCMVPVLPETAAKLHATVNGVWGGISGTHPILTDRKIVPAVQAKYGADDKTFAEACHKAGLVVVSVVNGIEGFTAMREAWPDLEKMACRDARGKPAQVSRDMILMCVSNPDWLQWEIDFGKRGIDSGADLVMVDTPMIASFISGFLRGGFCRHCMANFEKHLRAKFIPGQLKQRFGIDTFHAEAVIARLSPLQDLANPKCRPHHNTSQDDLLFREFISCQEKASFDTRKKLVDALRSYAGSKGRRIAICTNASDLGTANPGGHWIRALMFADLFDLFVYEQNVEPNGMLSNEVMKYPRGKWAAYHKLAYAVHHRRAPAVIHATAMGGLLVEVLTRGKTQKAWMEAQSAEAYASNGAYVQYYIEPLLGKRLFLDKCWAGSARHAAFVQSHRDLYEGSLASGSPLAILFLLNERGRTIPAVYPSYLGFAQALIEGNYPFDVVFAGDGRYVQDRLTGRCLEPYQTLLVPSPIDPTESQKRVVQSFVKAGGTLVCQEPERLGLADAVKNPGEAVLSCLERRFNHGKGKVLVLRGRVSETWTDDVGSNFFKTYRPELRTEIGRLAESLGLVSVVPGETSGMVSAFPVVQPDRKRLVLHLVNGDIDYSKDTIRPKADVAVSLPAPGFLPGNAMARWHIPGGEPRTLQVLRSAGRLSFSLPRLDGWATVVVSE